MRRTLRDTVRGTPLEGLQPHSFRKTVATLIARELDTATAAKVLGHASDHITIEHYIERQHVAPDVTHVTNILGP